MMDTFLAWGQQDQKGNNERSHKILLMHLVSKGRDLWLAVLLHHVQADDDADNDGRSPCHWQRKSAQEESLLTKEVGANEWLRTMATEVSLGVSARTWILCALVCVALRSAQNKYIGHQCLIMGMRFPRQLLALPIAGTR